MYAIIKTGGKQYKVTEGATLQIEKIPVAEGETVDFTEVLLVTDGNTVKVGTPWITDSKVTATVQGHGRGEKIKIIKFRRRKHHRKQMGHRQAYTAVKITHIIPDIQAQEAVLVEEKELPETLTDTLPESAEVENHTSPLIQKDQEDI